MIVEGGDNAVDVKYSTNKNYTGIPSGGVQIGEEIYTTKDNQIDSKLQHTSETIMGVSGGVEDKTQNSAYSTKPNSPNIYITRANNTIITKYNKSSIGEQGVRQISTSGGIMGVGGGIYDEAEDVTYSTKPDKKATTRQYSIGYGNPSSGIGVVNTTGNALGIGGGMKNKTPDVIYSTKQNNVNSEAKIGYDEISNIAKTTVITTGENINNLNIYNKATILKDKVQNIIQRDIQPIIKTVIKPIIQEEIQPIVEREIHPILQKEIIPVVEKEIQPLIQTETQTIIKKEIQPIIHKEIQPIIKREIQPIKMKEEKHYYQKKFTPKKEISYHKTIRTKIVPYRQIEEKHVSQKKILPSSETKIRNIEKIQWK